MAENKVQFNLKNVHYAILTEEENDGNIVCSYGESHPVRGAVSVDLAMEGEMSPFYADGVKYYVAKGNQGYSGSIELARIPDSMLANVFGMKKKPDGVIVETVEDEVKDFALFFQVDGDATDTFYVFYKCSASRPSIASQTNEESKEPQTQTLELTISPTLDNGKIKAHTTADAEYDIDAWVESPYGYGDAGDQ